MSFDFSALDPILLAEIAIVGLIILGQFYVFVRNLGNISQLRKLFPPAGRLSISSDTQVDLQAADTVAVPQIQDQPRFSSGFREILQMTNHYLRRNQGASQAERLQDIAVQKSDSMEDAIETNLPLPLYIGLFATFTGVIIGLVKIAFVGVTDAAIQSFIGGVTVGMVGAAMGLLLTVRSNQAFKSGREVRDQGLEAYFQFLRIQVIHPEAAPVQGSVKNLRESLSAFQEGFAQYQEQMNESLGNTLQLFRELKDVFKQIRTVEQELQGIGDTLRNNDELIERQAAYIQSYNQRAEAFVQQLSQHMRSIDQQVEAMVDENIKSLDQSTKTAYLKMDQYLASLEGTDRQVLARALSEDLKQVREEAQSLQEKTVYINAQLLERVGQDETSRKMLTASLQQLTQRLDKMDQEQRGLLASPAGQVFVYTGIGAFLLAIAGGGFYLAQALGLLP